MSDSMTIDDLTVIGIDGIRRSFDEHYDTMMEVEQDICGAHHAIQNQHTRIEELEAELAGAINVAYGVSEAAGKRRGELETKLVDVEGRLFNCAMDLNIYIDLVEKLQEELDNRERSNEL